MSKVRTRFAPSPTGFMHIGNLRTALYSYLLAKSKGGEFVLRIEDTDQKRYVDGAVDVIYNVLKDCGIQWDEGPDVGGSFGSYVQSERVKSGIYMTWAKKLVELGHAYYCFCKDCHSDIERYQVDVHYGHNERNDNFVGYDGHCRDLSKEEVEKNLRENKPFVIRQKLPKNIVISYHDEVFGDVSINTNDLDDQVLIKQDGYPTYNFANVIDDHFMQITHIVRGCEYMSATPKYVLLYKSFGWDVPKFVHLPLIMGEQDGVVAKLSKRNGAVTYDEFINQGYTKEAIINYIALLGWTPNGNQEFFTIEEMKKLFNIKNLNKSAAVFDYKKLDWLNGKYIRKMDDKTFLDNAYNFAPLQISANKNGGLRDKVLLSLKNKLNKFTEINNILEPLFAYNEQFDLNYFINEKIGADFETTKKSLIIIKDLVVNDTIVSSVNDNGFFEKIGLKKSVFMTAFRVVLTGISFSMLDPMLMVEVMDKKEIVGRIDKTFNRIK